MKNVNVSRRDFLKAAALLSANAFTSVAVPSLRAERNRQNIILILFDSMSALNLSLYGYARETTPALSNFADRCFVYNSHYSGGNFTSPGTASMLTGMLPWKNRVFNQGGLISRSLAPYSLYSLLGNDYFRLAFSQNFWADRLIGQSYTDVDRFLPQSQFSMRGNTLMQSWAGKDRSLASIAFDNFLFPVHYSRYGSSLLGYLYRSRVASAYETQHMQSGYPNGTPEVEGYFAYMNEVVMQGILSEITDLHRQEQPYFAYFHLFSPHAPYRPGDKFTKLFKNDDLQLLNKKANPIFMPSFTTSSDEILEKRRAYDQLISQLDEEFGKLIKQLDQSGVLDNSYVILTSDHGELFERGFIGHGGVMLYEPVVRIPLLIYDPNQKVRRDIYSLTSNIDILPTLLSIAGKSIPDELEGEVLPGFGGNENKERPIFSIFAWENSAFMPITKGVIAMRKNNYKLIQYMGYSGSGETFFELFDLENDPDELVNLSEKDTLTFNILKDELLEHINYANSHYGPK